MNPIDTERAVLAALFRRWPEAFVWIGGSVLQLVHHSPRASLDLDLTPWKESPEPEEIREEAEHTLGLLNAETGSQLRLSPDALHIEDAAQAPARRVFSVDISRIGGRPARTRTLLVSSLLGSAAVRVPLDSVLLQQKLRALLLRRFAKPGDLFDVWFLLDRGVRLTGPGKAALQDDLDAAEADVDERFASFDNDRWIKALERSGVTGLDPLIAAGLVKAVRRYTREVRR